MEKDLKKRKIIAGIIANIPLLFITILAYLYRPDLTNVWGGLIALMVVVTALIIWWKRMTLLLVIVIEFLAAGAIIGLAISDSMLRGIELVSGTQEGTYLFWPKQHGLLNSQDIMISVVLLIMTVATTVYLTMQRRRIS